MSKVFVLQHLHVLASGKEDVKMLGVYSSEPSAHAAVHRLRQLPGFRDHPHIINPSMCSDDQGFHIGKYDVDQDHWTEGYATV
ncbi:DUF7336 domain-containing protein [Dyella subtropica]|uniref:DUF7336 domain-containing protein n=1 Tax=Dyella subtropica TaxID=2992127 RepID=UPI003CE4B71F